MLERRRRCARQDAGIGCLLGLFCGAACAGPLLGPRDAGALSAVSVVEYHNGPTRDGVYTEPAFTTAAVGQLSPTALFSVTLDGPVLAHPLFVENGPQGRDAVIVATLSDRVYAFDALDGAILWDVTLGTPVASSSCGTLGTKTGIAGTPIIDRTRRLLYLDALVQSGVSTHEVVALAIDTGKIMWSLNLANAVSGFDADLQDQKGPAAILNDTVYFGFAALIGDCGNYFGRVIGVPLSNPTTASGWQSPNRGAGIWGSGSLAAEPDAGALYAVTGNADVLSADWTQNIGNAVLRLTPDATGVLSSAAADSFAPTDWENDDENDLDLTSSGTVLFEVPGASPSSLLLAIGKTQSAFLLDRTKLGGVGGELSRLDGAVSELVYGGMATYQTAASRYVAVMATAPPCTTGHLSTFKVTATAPPTLQPGFCVDQGGIASPIVTQSAPETDVLLWGLGANGDDRLRAFDGDTGALVYTSNSMPSVRRWMSPIEAKGRIYVVSDGALTAFGLSP